MKTQPSSHDSVSAGASDKFISRSVNIVLSIDVLPVYLRKRIKIQPCKNERVSGDCWVWQTALNEAGYGRVDWNGQRQRMAHKVIYELFYGPVPEGLEVDHLCLNPPCVNPAHLEAVTQLENIRRSHTTGNGNGTRTHCRQGHAFTPENIYSWRGKRFCLKCQTIRQRAYEERKATQSALPAGTLKQAAHDQPQASVASAPVRPGGSLLASAQYPQLPAGRLPLSIPAWRVSGNSLSVLAPSFPDHLTRFPSIRAGNPTAEVSGSRSGPPGEHV